MRNRLLIITLSSMLAAAGSASAADTAKAPTMADVIKASKPSDWHALDPQETMYVDLPQGRVVIELAPAFAPNHVKNIKALIAENYFDSLQILRSQDNYVVQWGDPHADARADDKDQPKPLQHAQRTLKAEFTVPQTRLPFTALPDRDGYAPQTGFSGDFAAARDPKTGNAWMTHCYGTVGVGRDLDVDSGGGTELYVVTGSSPRWLDRNITVVGRVVQGIELLSTMPRGTGPLGFYEKPEQRTTIKSIQLAANVPEAQRVKLDVMRTDTPTYTQLIESRRNRHDEWYKVPAGYIDVCSIPIPVRTPESK